MGKMKKNYQELKENPALSYISQMNSEGSSKEEILQRASVVDIEPVPKGYKIKPQYSEIKTRRVQLVFPPSLYKKVQSQAKKVNMSVNELVCLILDAVVNEAD